MKCLIIGGCLSIALFSSLMAQNIGINTPMPNAALDVHSTGNTSATYGVLVSNSANDTSLVVSDNGNVGIGTTLPVYTLDVQSTNPIAARFSGRVTGQDAVNANEFVTLQQANTLGGSGAQTYGTMFSALSANTMTYGGALIYCRNLTEGAYTDWRVPGRDEFQVMLMTDAVPLPVLPSSTTQIWLLTSMGYGTNTTGTEYETVYYYNGDFTTSYFYIRSSSSSYYAICVR